MMKVKNEVEAQLVARVAAIARHDTIPYQQVKEAERHRHTLGVGGNMRKERYIRKKSSSDTATPTTLPTAVSWY